MMRMEKCRGLLDAGAIESAHRTKSPADGAIDLTDTLWRPCPAARALAAVYNHFDNPMVPNTRLPVSVPFELTRGVLAWETTLFHDTWRTRRILTEKKGISNIIRLQSEEFRYILLAVP